MGDKTDKEGTAAAFAVEEESPPFDSAEVEAKEEEGVKERSGGVLSPLLLAPRLLRSAGRVLRGEESRSEPLFFH